MQKALTFDMACYYGNFIEAPPKKIILANR